MLLDNCTTTGFYQEIYGKIFSREFPDGPRKGFGWTEPTAHGGRGIPAGGGEGPDAAAATARGDTRKGQATASGWQPETLPPAPPAVNDRQPAPVNPARPPSRLLPCSAAATGRRSRTRLTSPYNFHNKQFSFPAQPTAAPRRVHLAGEQMRSTWRYRAVARLQAGSTTDWQQVALLRFLSD